MHNRSPLGNAKVTVRARICTQCFLRPPGSENLPPTTKRTCEPSCSVFINLPKLIDIVHTVSDASLTPYERATQQFVCQECQSSPTAGDYCADRTVRRCPLSVYLGDVVDALERVQK